MDYDRIVAVTAKLSMDMLTDEQINTLYMAVGLGMDLRNVNVPPTIKPLCNQDSGAKMCREGEAVLAQVWGERFG